MDKLNHNNQTQTKPEGMFKLIKPRFLILLVFVLSALIFTTFSIGLESASGVVYDSDGHQIRYGTTLFIMGPPESGDEICQFENTSKVDDYFIPTRYDFEWTAVKGVPAGHDLKKKFCCAIGESLCSTGHPDMISVCYNPQDHDCCFENDDVNYPVLCLIDLNLCSSQDCQECIYYIGGQHESGSQICANGEPDNGDPPPSFMCYCDPDARDYEWCIAEDYCAYAGTEAQCNSDPRCTSEPIEENGRR